jgi:uncharacterized protein (TIRG00374 family)
MIEQQAKQRRNRILSWTINLLGILILVLMLYLGGVRAWQQILQGDWRYVLAGFAVTLLWNLIATYRWQIIVNYRAGEPVCQFRYLFTYQMLGMLTGQVMPITIGMLGTRPVALSLSKGVPLRRSALSVLLDKSFDLLLALLLFIPVALYLVGWISLSLAFVLIGGLVLIGVLIIAWQFEQALRLLGRLGSRLAKPLARVPLLGDRLVRRLQPQLERLSSEPLLPNSLALQAFLVTLVMYALLAARLVYIAEAVHLDIPWYILAMSVAVTQLTLIFAVTPGSLGFLEGGWAAVFALSGLSLDQFTIFVIARRAYFLAFTVIDTLLAFAWIRESPARLFRAVLVASSQPQARPVAGSAPPVETGAQNGNPHAMVK